MPIALVMMAVLDLLEGERVCGVECKEMSVRCCAVLRKGYVQLDSQCSDGIVVVEREE